MVILRLEGEDHATLLLDVHDVHGLLLGVDVEDEHERVLDVRQLLAQLLRLRLRRSHL